MGELQTPAQVLDPGKQQYPDHQGDQAGFQRSEQAKVQRQIH